MGNMSNRHDIDNAGDCQLCKSCRRAQSADINQRTDNNTALRVNLKSDVCDRQLPIKTAQLSTAIRRRQYQLTISNPASQIQSVQPRRINIDYRYCPNRTAQTISHQLMKQLPTNTDGEDRVSSNDNRASAIKQSRSLHCYRGEYPVSD